MWVKSKNTTSCKFDETKNNVLQSKYPPDIVGFCEFFFHEIISADWILIGMYRRERIEQKIVVVVG